MAKTTDKAAKVGHTPEILRMIRAADDKSLAARIRHQNSTVEDDRLADAAPALLAALTDIMAGGDLDDRGNCRFCGRHYGAGEMVCNDDDCASSKARDALALAEKPGE
ncbi:MAG: hypothetical protein IMZ62_12785 [Chloroflexi bacterium]|nr:hypothetical protein [Chloroflexota bacterium]